MLNFSKRSSEPEILDNFDLKGHDLEENMHELEIVNNLLGGYSIVRSGVREVLNEHRSKPLLKIVDAGCGAGDILRMLARWGRDSGYDFRLTGIDANADAIAYAQKHSEGISDLEFKQMNILSPGFRELDADVITFNLFLHHFSEEQIVQFLKTSHQKNCAIIINDLQRSKIAYHLFRLLSLVLNFSHIGRHDGKLSVKKGFTKTDWKRIFKKAEIDHYQIKWRWAFRWFCIIK